MHKVEVPLDYVPKFELCYRKDRKRYCLTYLIPNCSKKTTLTLPENIQSEKHAIDFKHSKSMDLVKGILTDKEYQKYEESFDVEQIISFDDGFQKYKEIDTHKKKQKTQDTDNYCIQSSLGWIQEIRTEKGKIACKNLNDVKQDHILLYRQHLLKQAELRKQAEENFRKKAPTIKSLEAIEELRKITNSIGISYATAETKLRRIFTFFRKLNKVNTLNFNPCDGVDRIAPKTSDKVRNISPTRAEIIQIREANYVHPYGFPLIDVIDFLAETGARLGEVLHMEFDDVVNGIWRIRVKKNCPTKYGMGWSPKFEHERDVALSPRALEIFERMKERAEGRIIVGYMKHDYVDNDPKKGNTPYRARFVFTINDYGRYNKGGLRRCDDFKKAWKSHLKAAKVRSYEFEGLNLHDFRRWRNELNDKVKGFSAKKRGEEIGNSETVNQKHYQGKLDDEILQMAVQLRSLKEELLAVKEENKKIKETVS